MEIRTYVGTEFTISSVDENVQLPAASWAAMRSVTVTVTDQHRGTYRGDLINPQDLRVLASIIEWGKEQGVELDFSID